MGEKRVSVHGEDQRSSPDSARAAGLQRQRVLNLLREAPGPVDARHVAEALSIHVTTARFHLSALESQGVVRRATESRGRGAGRPRLTYEPAPRLDYADIVSLFAAHLGGTASERAERATLIGADLAHRVRLTRSRDVESAADLVAEVLGDLGFQISSMFDALGEVTVSVCTCPLAEIAVEAPEVVRGIQQGLIQEVLDQNAAKLGSRYAVRVAPDAGAGSCQVRVALLPSPSSNVSAGGG